MPELPCLHSLAGHWGWAWGIATATFLGSNAAWWGFVVAAAGSKHHGLDSHYQQWLSSLQPYCPPGQVAATLGALTSGAVLMSAASTAVPAYVLSRALGSGSQQPVMSAGAGSEYGGELQAQPASSMATQGSCSSSGSRAGEDTQGSQAGAVPDGFVPFVRWYTGASQKLVWDVHDKLAPWLGSGSSRSS